MTVPDTSRSGMKWPEPVDLGLQIAGESVMGRSDQARLESINPLTGQVSARYPLADETDVDRAASAAAAAMAPDGEWSCMSGGERAVTLLRLADHVDAHAEELGLLESSGNGRLLRETRGQMRGAAAALRYFGGLADKIEGRIIPLSSDGTFAYTRREPVGPVAIITPWNSPVSLTMISAAPALAAGNAIVAKPSDYTAAAVLRLAELFSEVGLPAGVFNVIAGGAEVATSLVDDARIGKVTFTGASAIGMSLAGRLGSRLAPFTAELGGKSANIVFADADLDDAVEGAVGAIFSNAGQSCVAGSRLLVQESIYDSFIAHVAERAKSLRIGDPLDPGTELGPIASGRHLERIEWMVGQAIADGASVRCGGARVTVPGFEDGLFYPATILGDVANEDPIAQREVFGPVLVPISFRDDAEAISIANGTPYGLAGAVWTRDIDRAHWVAARLEAGLIWINTYKSMSHALPFGGYKESGLGRLGGSDSLEPFLQTKTVWVQSRTRT